MQTLQIGTTLQGGKYRIVRFLSSGGFGNTYEGVHTLMDTQVAIKEFFPKMFCNREENTVHVTVTTQDNRKLVDKLRKKFNEEAKAVFQMNHPNIVRVLDIFEENGTAYYVMEYIDGKSLNDIVKERGALPEAEAVGYIRQVADALKYVHSLNRLHLDIKPGNIMVDKNGKAILIDFGASKHYDDESGENTSTLMGVNTKGYAPIEQSTQGFTSFSPATDIYALGATLYKLLTGITPPDANLLLAKEEMLQPLPSAISKSTCKAVLSAMQLIRAERIQIIDDFISQLCQDEGGEDTIGYVKHPTPKKDRIGKEENGVQNPRTNSKDITWWESEGLVPVSIWNFWGKNPKVPYKKIWLVITSIILFPFGISCIAGGIIYENDILADKITDSLGHTYYLPSNDQRIAVTLIALLSLIPLCYFLRNWLVPNSIVKRRKELLQTDYVFEYDTRKVKYAIVARGNSSERKYGLFDVEKLRLVIPFKYNRMTWDNPNKTLKVETESESYIIDIKENIFK